MSQQNVYFGRDLHIFLLAAAEAEHRTFSQMVQVLCKEAIKARGQTLPKVNGDGDAKEDTRGVG